MADNVEITSGTGTTIAADEVTRNAVLEKQQIIKVALGADGAHDTLVDSGQQTMANSVPVVVASDQTAIPVSLSSTPLPTGAATAANQSTQITAEQAIQAAVQIMDDWDDGADSAKIVGNVASAGSDSGNPVKVGGVYNSTLPTFTNGQRGDLQIGTRGSASVTLFAANSVNPIFAIADNADGVTEDSTANKLMVLSRNSMFNGTTWDRIRGTTTDGLLVNLGTNNDVTVTGSVTANAGTNLNTSALLTTAAHDAAFGTAGTADSQVRSIQGIASMTPVQVGDNSSSLTVDNGGTFAVQVDGAALTSLQLIDDAIATTGSAITTKGVAAAGTDGTNARILKTDTSGELQIDVLTSALPTGASTLAEQQTQTASLSVMDDWDNTASDGASVSGDVAHDGVDAGEPVKIGGKATDVGAALTVANNDRANAAFLRNGVQLNLGGAHDILSKNLNITDGDGAQTDTALITVSAGTAIVVTMVQVYVDSATTATGGVAVRIGFGTANVPAADSAGIIFAHPGISAGSGAVVGSGAGIVGIGASNEDLRITCEDPTGGNIDVIITYFTIAIG